MNFISSVLNGVPSCLNMSLEPYFRFFAIRHRCVPCVDGVGLARHETPVDGGHVTALEQWQDVLETTAAGAYHVFRANQGAVIARQCVEGLLVGGGVLIIMIGDDVRMSQLEMIQFGELQYHAARNRLRGFTSWPI